MASSSSLLCQLISVVAIGTLLMIVPDVQALECYHYDNKTATSAGGYTARELNKMFTIPTGDDEENPLILFINGGKPTRKCSAGYNFCAVIHCTSMFGANTVKACTSSTWSQNPIHICQKLRGYCPGDPMFYCRFCDTDRCNDDDLMWPSSVAKKTFF